MDSPRIQRAGVIPWIRVHEVTLFIFGLDESIASISDFGGRREFRDRTVYDCALREFSEESVGFLGKLTLERLKSSPSVWGPTGYEEEEGVIFFVEYSKLPIFSKMREFKQRSIPGDETKGLIVLTKAQLDLALESPDEKISNSKLFVFHTKVRSLLRSGREIWSAL